MNKLRFLFLHLIALIAISGCQTNSFEQSLNVRDVGLKSTSSEQLFQKNIQKIAVIALPNKRISSRQIEAIFIDGLQGKSYQVTSRSDLPSIQQEQSFQRSGLTSAGAAKIGRILNADAVLISEITEIGFYRNNGRNSISSLTMVAKLIEVETADVLWVDTKSYTPSLIGSLASVVQQVFIGENSPQNQVAIGIIQDFPQRNN